MTIHPLFGYFKQAVENPPIGKQPIVPGALTTPFPSTFQGFSIAIQTKLASLWASGQRPPYIYED